MKLSCTLRSGAWGLLVSLTLLVAYANSSSELSAPPGSEPKDSPKDFFETSWQNFTTRQHKRYSSEGSERLVRSGCNRMKSEAGDAAGAFLQGANQAITGQHFLQTHAVLNAKQYKKRACGEYGRSYSRNDSLYDSLSSYITQYNIATDVENSIAEARWVFEDAANTDAKLSQIFTSEDERLKNAFPPNKPYRPKRFALSTITAKVVPTVLSKDQGMSRLLTQAEANYYCCLRGFEAGADFLQESLKKAGNDQPKVMECKDEFAVGKKVALDACKGVCDDPDKERKVKSRLGCFSIGYIETVAECEKSFEQMCPAAGIDNSALNSDKNIRGGSEASQNDSGAQLADEADSYSDAAGGD
ncbi:MAG: hypothetical protein A2428_01720 [Bdellovibrionales bacterium RIFOXYC1_FULL_54_43]|nr:MAG: hypothetical protein A2428_01720 [Bdellovibrionales bacterium RIFOXYC1_FULL_54_43]OFZ83648.1 MAG: hypothetical protein A2603_16480 [Bdellovibrionales bacterium RIFOXYD1_FULL_55_31]